MVEQLAACTALLDLPGVGPVRLAGILRALAAAGMPVQELFSREGRDVVAASGIDRQALDAVEPGAHRLGARLEEIGVRCLLSLRSGCKSVGAASPPLLFVQGDAQLLGAVGVGFCGSRNASDRGIAVAGDIADQVAHSGPNVVSGGARGVDTAAHVAALAAGGTTTVVLPEGIARFRPRRELRDVLDLSRALLVSQFHPNAPWLAGRAMSRNATICTLARAMVLIEAGPRGGTLAAGKTAVSLGLPLFIVDYAEPSETNRGNRELLEAGAAPVRCRRSTGRANLDRLFARLRGDTDQAVRDSSVCEQRSLWSA